MDDQSDILPSLLSGLRNDPACSDGILSPDPVEPSDAPDVHVISVSGFGTGSSGELVGSGPETSGVGQIADDLGNAYLDSTVDKYAWDEKSEIVDRLQSFSEDDHIIGVAHSAGVGTLLDAAREADVNVDSIYTLDHPAFATDESKPDNVAFGTNFFSTSSQGVDGDANLGSMTNIGVGGTTHTDIDNDPRVANWIAEDSQGAIALNTPPEPAAGTFGAFSDPWTSSVDWGSPASGFGGETTMIKGCDEFSGDSFGGSGWSDSGSDSGSNSATGGGDSGNGGSDQ